MSSNGKQKMEQPQLTPPPSDRHLSTVGIGAVFLSSSPASDAADRTEFVGRIKSQSQPEDFVVREIGGLPRGMLSTGRPAANTPAVSTAAPLREEIETAAEGETTTPANVTLPVGNKSDEQPNNGAAAEEAASSTYNESLADAAARLYPAVRVAAITDTETLPGSNNHHGNRGAAAGTGGGDAVIADAAGADAKAAEVERDDNKEPGPSKKRPRLEDNSHDGPMPAVPADANMDGAAAPSAAERMADMPHDVFLSSRAAKSASASAVPANNADACANAKEPQAEQAGMAAEAAATISAAAAKEEPTAGASASAKLVTIIDPVKGADVNANDGEGARTPPTTTAGMMKRSASVDTTNSEAAPLSSHLSPLEILELILLESSGSGSAGSAGCGKANQGTPGAGAAGAIYDGQAILAAMRALNDEGRARLVPPPPSPLQPPQPPVEVGVDVGADDANANDGGKGEQLHFISNTDSLPKKTAPIAAALANTAAEGGGNANRAEETEQEHKNVVYIPYIANDIAIVDPDYGLVDTGSRGTFHRSLKAAFPLLKSRTLSEKDSRERSVRLGLLKEEGEDENGNAEQKHAINGHPMSSAKTTQDAAKQRWVRVEINDCFLPLVPYLLHSKSDLLRLYHFRNRGCVIAAAELAANPTPTAGEGVDGESVGVRRGGNNNHRSRRHRSHHHHTNGGRAGPLPANPTASSTVASVEPHVALRLRSDLTKEQRREIHTLISSRCRDFETSTVHGEDGVSAATITVRWSKQAQRIANRKRKRIGGGGGGGGPNSKGMIERSYVERSYSTLCVMRKRQVEHLSAINHIVSVLRCRQSDVGLAGIKDMMGVTYQFCTLRNVNPRRARDANKRLRTKGMELGNFERVDFALNQGDLLGNTFEIIVRDIKSVVLHTSSEGQVLEEFADCQPSQIEDRVKCLRRTGFINFYGMQRVGIAGDEKTVGVRPFDIGRAMLQNDFTTAIDLLMRGRLKGRGDEFAESEEIRKARALWKETGGSDPSAVLKAIPRGFLDRERSVLKGLKRYGEPLAAIRCLHHGIRMFWINSYQSVVWNQMASERIKRLGPQPAVGDIYQEDGQTREVKVVTDPTKVTLGMIVLPLPGYDVEYPTNEIGDLYRSTLASDGVEFKKDAVPEATARGAYRNLVAPANNLAVSFVDTTEDGTVGNASFTFELQSGSYATMLLRELMFTTMRRKDGN